MRNLRVLLAAASLSVGSISGPALWAADPATTSRPSIEPAPKWVLPAEIPPAPSASEGAATVDLLTDEQVRFGRDGDSTYYHDVYRIASPEGLGDAALQLVWDPSLEKLAVHKYQIVRDGKIIDLLGDGSKISVIRRETNIESATLDGRLTAIMQPPDIRVGDIVDLAFTRTRYDPALGGKSEALIGPSDGHAYGRFRLRFLWPRDKTLQWRKYPGILDPKLSQGPEGSELVADLTDVTTPIAPDGAPAHYQIVSAIDISEFPDWGSVVDTLLPLYTKAETLSNDSPVKAQARQIAAKTSDPIRRAELALQLVEEQVRYLYMGMDDGGYVPANADLTWSRKFGDCKGKTVLLAALLNELGIDAEPVLVNTRAGDVAANRLPAVASFDHVLVRARINGKTYWLDGTGIGDKKLSWLRTPSYKVGLPLAANSNALIPLVPEELTQPGETISMALDASAGIDAPAPAHGEMRFRGEAAPQVRMKYAGLSVADRDKQLREFWRKSFDFISPTTVDASVDEQTGDFVITMSGTAKMDWYADVGTRWYEVDRARLGWRFDIDRTGQINTDAPFAVNYPDFWESRETIKLPSGGTGFTLQGGSVDQEVGGIYSFHRKVEIADGVMTMEASTRALADELPASKAEQVQSELGRLANGSVFVRVPDDYMATEADIAALQKDKKALAEALVHRGAVHFDRGEYQQSLGDENSVIALDPDNARAHAIRALALAAKQDPKADQAADRALALDDKQSLAWMAKGSLAITQRRFDDAIVAYSKLLELDPDNAQALVARATARLALGKFAESLADLDSALAKDPSLKIRIIRAAALAGLSRREEALAEADRAVSAQPGEEELLSARAELRASLNERKLAMEDYDALIKQAPKAEYYLRRAAIRPASDKAGMAADIEAALKLEPKSKDALASRASLAMESGDFASAERDIAAIEKADPSSDLVYNLKMRLFEKQGRPREALQVVDAYVAEHPADAVALNNRCWTKATLNIEIETAVADCDASLKLSPNSPATLDSRGFAKFRLGSIDAALSDYDAALKLAPDLAASLFGRAIILAQKGDNEKARLDLDHARRVSPEIESRFAEYGVTLPASLSASEASKPVNQ